MSEKICFGSFELDLETAELCANGQRSRLPEQQFRILQMLLLAEGRVVLREEIRNRLWPNDTVVEFDRSINTAMMKLRIALGDTGDKPRMIETLPRRGYRLMVAVEQKVQESPGPSDGVNKPGSLIGQRISHYRVLEIVDGGGMGVVYKALDLKLDRAVALKFLPEEMGKDEKAIARFEREARAVSALDHPNICPIFEFGEQEGRPFIVMPLLDGRNLRDTLADCDNGIGRLLPLQKILELSIQIVSGLQAAHDKGIIHRDIKPANIFISQRGVAQILDFGIAKMIPAGEELDGEVEDARGGAHWTSSTPTDQTQSLTRTGIAVGSAGYMSPEQVRGEKLDVRTDLFSFGLVLYEMVTGQRAFSADTAAIVQNAILNQSPTPVRELNRDLPVELDKIVDRALQKDRELRYGSAAEMLADLKTVKQETPLDTPPRSSKRIWRWGGAIAALLLLITSVFWYFSPVHLPKVTGSKQLTNGSFVSDGLLTDGLRLYFLEDLNGARMLAQMSVSGGDISLSPVPISHPQLQSISRDGSQLLLSDHSSESAHFWILPLPTGAPRRAEDLEATAATWSADAKQVVFSRGPDVYITDASGSNPTKIASVPQTLAVCAVITPDGSHVRFTGVDQAASISTFWEVQTDGSGLHQLLRDWPGKLDINFNWTPDGRYFLFASESSKGTHDIFAMRESQDLFRRQQAEPTQLTFGPIRFEMPLASADGKKLFVLGRHQRGELVYYDTLSRRLSPFLGGISATDVAFSPDGKWIVYASIPSYDLWRSRVDGSEKVQLTSSTDGTIATLPRWSPDGKTIAYTSETPGRLSQVMFIGANGGKPWPLPSEGAPHTDVTWSPDSTQVVYTTGVVEGSAEAHIEIYDLHTHQFSIVPNSVGKFSPRWSPDGRDLVALSFELRPHQMFLYDFHTNLWTDWITENDIGYQTWSADGRSVQYMQGFNNIGSSVIRRLKIGDSHSTVLYSVKGLHLLGGKEGLWSADAPDGSRMFVRDASGRDIYALDVDFP
jgi:serine/threonine protein kinase/DNA-binding winged helix-turn-helix (wHTH) protein